MLHLVFQYSISLCVFLYCFYKDFKMTIRSLRYFFLGISLGASFLVFSTNVWAAAYLEGDGNDRSSLCGHRALCDNIGCIPLSEQEQKDKLQGEQDRRARKQYAAIHGCGAPIDYRCPPFTTVAASGDLCPRCRPRIVDMPRVAGAGNKALIVCNIPYFPDMFEREIVLKFPAAGDQNLSVQRADQRFSIPPTVVRTELCVGDVIRFMVRRNKGKYLTFREGRIDLEYYEGLQIGSIVVPQDLDMSSEELTLSFRKLQGGDDYFEHKGRGGYAGYQWFEGVLSASPKKD